MDNKIEISFLIDAKKYCEYKDICFLKNTNPARELNSYVADIVEQERREFSGFKVIVVSASLIPGKFINLEYEGDEKNRQEGLANYISELSPDLIIVSDFIYKEAKDFINCISQNDYMERYYNRDRNYSIFSKDNTLVKKCEEENLLELKKEENQFLLYLKNIDKQSENSEEYKLAYKYAKLKKLEMLVVERCCSSRGSKIVFTMNDKRKKRKSIIRYDSLAKTNNVTDENIYIYMTRT